MSDAGTTAGASPTAGSEPREQSTIRFPYGDLDDAVAVAEGIMACGGMPCAADQLAARLNQMPTSGGFRTRIATARTFGLIETVQGKYRLTELGADVTDPKRQRAARADAFLKVPLYRKLYDEFRNRQLPPRPLALEQTFVAFGVAPRQKEKARQAFERSAKQAGYFDQAGHDRLIRPSVATRSPPQAETLKSAPNEPDNRYESANFGGNEGRDGIADSGRLHPFIQGLLDSLPEPNTSWTEEARVKWLQAAANIFDLMYEGDAGITVRGRSQSSGHG